MVSHSCLTISSLVLRNPPVSSRSSTFTTVEQVRRRNDSYVLEMLGSITGMNRKPIRRVKAASAEAKFPEDDSITVVSSQISWRSAARLRIQYAGRSLMLPTGFTYSSLANRFMCAMARCTCGVGRSVLPSCSKRVTRLGRGRRFRRPAGALPGSTPGPVPGIYLSTPVVSLTRKSNVCSSDAIGELCANATKVSQAATHQQGNVKWITMTPLVAQCPYAPTPAHGGSVPRQTSCHPHGGERLRYSGRLRCDRRVTVE